MMDWGALSRAERDAAYNNTDAVADSAALNAARTAASATCRAAWPGSLDVPYGPEDRQRWDIFPAADSAAPCFVFIHGGYWQRNRREDFSCLGEGLRTHGWSVALPGYTLAPQATMCAIVAEIHAALDWLATHGAEHGVAGPVLLSGWSAGGHLTAMGGQRRAKRSIAVVPPPVGVNTARIVAIASASARSAASIAGGSDDKSNRANQPRTVSPTRDGAMQLTASSNSVAIRSCTPIWTTLEACGVIKAHLGRKHISGDIAAVRLSCRLDFDRRLCFRFGTGVEYLC